MRSIVDALDDFCATVVNLILHNPKKIIKIPEVKFLHHDYALVKSKVTESKYLQNIGTSKT